MGRLSWVYDLNGHSETEQQEALTLLFLFVFGSKYYEVLGEGTQHPLEQQWQLTTDLS